MGPSPMGCCTKGPRGPTQGRAQEHLYPISLPAPGELEWGGVRSGEYEAPEPNNLKNRATGGVLQSTQFHTFPPLGHVSLHKPVRKTFIEGKRGNEPPLRLPLLSTQDRTHFPRGSMRAELARAWAAEHAGPRECATRLRCGRGASHATARVSPLGDWKRVLYVS